MNMRAWFFAQKGNKVDLLLRRKREGERDWHEIGIVEAANEDFVAIEKGGRSNLIPYHAIDRFRTHEE
ncbi:MAG: hypothetical protein ACYTDU_03445 [Planctomycetota bacterium]|jgi:ribosome maturation factor RimP